LREKGERIPPNYKTVRKVKPPLPREASQGERNTTRCFIGTERREGNQVEEEGNWNVTGLTTGREKELSKEGREPDVAKSSKEKKRKRSQEMKGGKTTLLKSKERKRSVAC